MNEKVAISSAMSKDDGCRCHLLSVGNCYPILLDDIIHSSCPRLPHINQASRSVDGPDSPIRVGC